ncbi:MAG TPA: hypothetical protein EYQ66_13360 [Myxococcales bacterium]|nr:hypothetical protein [Myxococcales bacterium]
MRPAALGRVDLFEGIRLGEVVEVVEAGGVAKGKMRFKLEEAVSDQGRSTRIFYWKLAVPRG